ncbi:hypothetical protein GCM10027174_36880 [Salinifilum aidingensis]
MFFRTRILSTSVLIAAVAALAGTAHAAPQLRTADSPDAGQPQLVDIRVGTHPTFDRVVFDYRGGVPDADVEYGEVRRGGSGHPVDLAGERSLAVSMQHVAWNSQKPPERLLPDLPQLAEVNYHTFFEGAAEVGLGINGPDRAPLNVFTLRDPDRLVIDVAHPGACGDVAFAPQSDHGAFGISASGIGCGPARDAAALADRNLGEPYTTPGGFSCQPRRSPGELPEHHYTCTRGATQEVTFDAS